MYEVFMSTKTVITFVLVMLGVLIGVGGLLWQFGQADTKAIADIAGEMRHKKGEGEIVVTEFSDFQCPACQAAHEPLKQIMGKYEGKVSLVYRQFPLTSIHKNAQLAAQAAEAAGIQGKFWEYGDVLFAKQQEWAGLADPRETFMSYAQTLELEVDKFGVDMDSQATKDAIANDVVAATRYRINGTPTFYVNGIKLELAQLEVKVAELTK